MKASKPIETSDTLMQLHTLADTDVQHKTVLLRADLNVPMTHGKIEDDTRIARLVPTIEALIAKQAKVVVMSHFGRPKGEFNLDMSLAPLVDVLSEKLGGREVLFSVDCIGHNAEETIARLEPGGVALLENVRFHPGETSNDPAFAKALASLGDVFINDTFSCSHRSHASIIGIAQYLPSCAGLLLQQEIEQLEKYLLAPEAPLAAVVGGSKVSTKLELLDTLIHKVQHLSIGGAMANTFLLAQGIKIGTSRHEKDLVKTAKAILAEAEKSGCFIHLPKDVVVASQLAAQEPCDVVSIDAVPKDKMILDIGPETVSHWGTILSEAKTLIWNGPLGAFEFRPFDVGTCSLARYAGKLTHEGHLTSVAGGGDIVAALGNSGISHSFSYLSTAGGAFLEWLEGHELPGISVLRIT